MNPTSTRRLRRATAALAMGWALLAIVLSAGGALRDPEGRFVHPFVTLRTGTAVVVETVLAAMTPISRSSAVTSSIAVNGVPFVWALRRGIDWLKPDVPNSYLVEKADGRRVTVELPPEPLSKAVMPAIAVVHVLVLLVAGDLPRHRGRGVVAQARSRRGLGAPPLLLRHGGAAGVDDPDRRSSPGRGRA